jgi:hypothetical protein
MNVLNEKFGFMRSANFKLVSRMQGNSISNCDFFKDRNFFSEAAIVITRPRCQKPSYATEWRRQILRYCPQVGMWTVPTLDILAAICSKK